MKCDRCKENTRTTSMSWFNTQDLCEKCQEQEENHPDYARAKSEEEKAVKSGNYNYPGVGWPGLKGRL